MTTKRKRNRHDGSSFDSFLREESLYEEVTAAATKRVLSWQIAQAMKKGKVTKTDLAKRMKTSRAAIDRLLDPTNAAVTLKTMGQAASALGKRLTVKLEAV
jgi:hypothetical protein